MGLIIDGMHVAVDHTCKDWLVTEPEGNPTEEWAESLKVWSIFRRRLASAKLQRKRDVRQLGDNCPIIYALKGKEGLTTDLASVLALNKSFKIIIQEIALREPAGFDLVISMPSSHALSRMIANRFSRQFRAPHLTGVLEKITLQEAFNLLDRADIDVADYKRLSFRLRKQLQTVGFNGSFSLKDVPPGFRYHLPPLKLLVDALEERRPERILLVDDLLATGTTMITAAELLQQQYPKATITGACLFGSAGR